jgi:hypothetical protein
VYNSVVSEAHFGVQNNKRILNTRAKFYAVNNINVHVYTELQSNTSKINSNLFIYFYLFIYLAIHLFAAHFTTAKIKILVLRVKIINKILAGSNVNQNGRGLGWGPIIAERER